jgi:hypothetical protein
MPNRRLLRALAKHGIHDLDQLIESVIRVAERLDLSVEEHIQGKVQYVVIHLLMGVGV